MRSYFVRIQVNINMRQTGKYGHNSVLNKKSSMSKVDEANSEGE